MKKKRAVLFVNLGTPEKDNEKSVKQFLKQFLSDKRVVDLPRFFWLPLLHLVILPFRTKKATKAYQKIWTPTGSPLRIITERLINKLGSALEKHEIVCDFAMTYGKPTIAEKIINFERQGITDLTIIPLYPQYSVSTTAPVFDQVASLLMKQVNFPAINFKHDYHDHPLYIDALCLSIKTQWAETGQSEKLVLSFHGIPKRYVTKGDPYQAQCERTTELVVKQLGLDASQYILAYQSRMGKEQWLMPYVDKEIVRLAESGCTSIDVICPAFSTDCLETLEEMAIENKLLYLQAGGQKFNYIECLNDSNSHVKLMVYLAFNR
ncbi:ferrochelatase [Psychromonas hadalis]|uniref:ferrochelatase n=1 Tax=Psychromonas hadalis TaxID=211669 RepID=UPI0003B5F594|nr:ferrochelatase [Psychromonas hadalis]